MGDERNIHYRTKSLKQLVEGYAFESGRANQEDKEAAQTAIVMEVYARIKDTFEMLDADPSTVEKMYTLLYLKKIYIRTMIFLIL